MSNIPDRVEGATIVIVGASSGFGRGAALELAKRGAKVVVAARRSELLDELVHEVRDAGGHATAVALDVGEPDAVERLAAQAVEEHGRIDVWVNNVGVGALGYFWEIPVEVHARVVDVNLKGLIYGAHAAMKQFLRQDGGTLVNVGSIDSEIPLAMQNTYAASKAAVLSLSRTLNEELRLAGRSDAIHVATIMPWAVDTPWWDHAANYSGHTARMAMMDDPELVVEAIVKACTHPEEEMPVGIKAKAFDASHHLLPDLTERMSATVAKRESDKGAEIGDTRGSLFEPMHKGRTMDGGVRERMKREDA